MADPTNSADDKEAKLAEIKAKMAEAKARREAAEAAGTSGAAASASPSPSPAGGGTPPAAASASPGQPLNVPPGTDPEKAAKIAELQAKMAEAKAKREASGAGTVTAAAGAGAPTGGTAATATATAPAATATATAPAATKTTSEVDARIAAMRAKIAETKNAPLPATEAARRKGKEDVDTGVWYLGRRNFLQSIGWMSFFGFLTIVILGAVRAMFPRVIYEKPPIFKAGFPSDYVPGTVSERYKDSERVWIIRQNDGSFVALLAICTHLGCTPRWLASENKFKCPCHGSGFRGTPNWGVNFEGPAPRPLERLAIHLAPDGQIEIDSSKKFLWEKQQWGDPAATLTV
jgi:cytochrome b6-f complex iron-sulfur subunit